MYKQVFDSTGSRTKVYTYMQSYMHNILQTLLIPLNAYHSDALVIIGDLICFKLPCYG